MCADDVVVAAVGQAAQNVSTLNVQHFGNMLFYMMQDPQPVIFAGDVSLCVLYIRTRIIGM